MESSCIGGVRLLARAARAASADRRAPVAPRQEAVQILFDGIFEGIEVSKVFVIQEDLGGSILTALGLHVVLQVLINGNITGFIRNLLSLEDHFNSGLLLLDIKTARD